MPSKVSKDAQIAECLHLIIYVEFAPTQQETQTAFVLLGRLSPTDGIGPEDLGIDDLLNITNNDEVNEVILATSSTVEGDATAIFIKDHITNAKVSRISYGIPIGGELEYVDGTTIARAIEGRIEIDVD